MTFEPGCYGDGTLGHRHTRSACAEMLDTVMTQRCEGSAETFEILQALQHPMSDDAQEETGACDYLNEHAPHDLAAWGWQDGDFGLWTTDEASNG